MIKGGDVLVPDVVGTGWWGVANPGVASVTQSTRRAGGLGKGRLEFTVMASRGGIDALR